MVTAASFEVQITKILAKGGKIIDEFKIVEKKNVVKEDKKVIKKEEKNRNLNGNKKSRWIVEERPR